MGPLIAAALEDPDVVEVMLNPDRTLWVDRLSSGRAPMGAELPETDGERIIRLVAAHVGAEVHRGQPLLSAELPETGERFEGDRKSTRLNSSHLVISYAVFCLKKKKRHS